MGRQRNMFQMGKKTNKTEKELNKMEKSNLLDTELKTLVIKMINKLSGKVYELRVNFNRDQKHKNADRKYKKESQK